MYSVGRNIKSPEFCVSGVRPASVDNIVSSILDRSSPNLEHTFPLTSRKIGQSPEMGVIRVTSPKL